MPRLNRSNRNTITFMDPIVGDPQEAPSQQRREVSSTPSVYSQRDMSVTPSAPSALSSAQEALQYDDEQDDAVDPNDPNAPSIRWAEPIMWVFLQIMLGIHDELSEATDTHYKRRIWDNALELFKQELSEHVEGSARFCSLVTVLKMQKKWGALKRKYKDLYNAAILQTGVGGSDPATRWKYYDEIGQILVNDPSIRPEVSIETYGMSETGGPVTTDNRNQNAESPAEREAAADERARSRNVRRINSDTIKEKVINPSKRYAELFVSQQADRHAAGLELETPSMFTNIPSSSSASTIVTGAGRTTRSRSANEEEATPSTSTGSASQRRTPAATTNNHEHHQQYLRELGNQTTTLMEFLEQQRLKRKEDGLQLLVAMNEMLKAEDDRVLEAMSRKRKAENQELLEQLFAMRQGQAPNLFASENQRSSPAPVPLVPTPSVNNTNPSSPVLVPSPVLTPSVTTESAPSFPTAVATDTCSVVSSPVLSSPVVPPSSINNNRPTITFITTVPEDMSSEYET